MAKKIKNQSLGKAKDAKKDEFYTQLSDIEKELKHYRKHFKGKVVYCNCDDPRVSNFFHYFSYNFEKRNRGLRGFLKKEKPSGFLLDAPGAISLHKEVFHSRKVLSLIAD